MQRRDFLFGTAGFVVGTVFVFGTAATMYQARKARRAAAASAGPRRVQGGMDDWVLTDADRSEIAARNAMSESQSLELLDNIDIPGAGDMRSERVANVDECIASCEGDDSCNAFTFARMSHPNAGKRHMCWIKSDRNPERLVSDVHYISGRRP